MSHAEPSVLIVDDERVNIDLMVDLLKPHYRTLVATNGVQALKRASGEPRPDILLLDVMMPEMDGYEVCRRLKADAATQAIPVIFVTAMSEVGDEMKGFALGAVDYITKPISPPIVEARVRAHLENKHARDFIEDRNRVLQGMVLERTRELAATQDATILSMATLAETRDPETGHHLQRTQGYVRSVAVRLRTHPRFRDELDDHAIDLLFKSAPLHDIGKVGVPDSILRKPGKLTPEEYEVMKQHVVYGYEAIVATEKLLAARRDLQRRRVVPPLRPRDRPQPPREVGRLGLSRRAGGRRDPALRPPHGPGRRLRRAHLAALLQAGVSRTRRRSPRSWPAAARSSTPTWSTPSPPWTMSSWRSPAATPNDACARAWDRMTSSPKSRESDTWVSGLEPLGPDEDPEPTTPEVRIGPYKLLDKLGEGGMGTVWVAEQTEPVRRRVALKVIKAGMDSQEILQRFEAERQALALMKHRNIATVLDAGTSEAGLPYFVMELVEGVPITKYCDDRKSSILERLKLFVAVCHAIQHAHQKGILHRDIKPANVLVSMEEAEPVPKVIDFGVAKALHKRLTERPMYTEVGQLVGTLEYMSPEQADITWDIDTRADVYALGVLLYVLLVGSTPIDADTLRSAPLSETLRLIREVDPPKPSVRLTQSGESLERARGKTKLRSRPADPRSEGRAGLDRDEGPGEGPDATLRSGQCPGPGRRALPAARAGRGLSAERPLSAREVPAAAPGGGGHGSRRAGCCWSRPPRSAPGRPCGRRGPRRPLRR